MGSGVLLVYAARAGAKCVDGIEAVSEAAALARATLRMNSLVCGVHDLATPLKVPYSMSQASFNRVQYIRGLYCIMLDVYK